jgi:uncharacterized protein HemX
MQKNTITPSKIIPSATSFTHKGNEKDGKDVTFGDVQQTTKVKSEVTTKTNEESNDNTESSDEGSGSGWLYAIIAIVVLGAIGGGAYFYFNSKKSKATSDNQFNEGE